MDIAGRYIAVLVYDYFEQAEFEEPASALRNAGGTVTVIGARGTALTAMNHEKPGDTFQADLLISQANSTDYDALVIPGGVINADRLRMVAAARQWVSDFLEAGKPLAVICHAPWLLVSAGAVDGRRLTSYFTLQDDIRNAGGEWIDQPVVTDGSLITSRRPDDLPQFSDALIAMLRRLPAGPLQSGPNELVGATEQQTDDDNRLKALGYDKRRDDITPPDEADLIADEQTETDEDLQLPLNAHEEEQRNPGR